MRVDNKSTTNEFTKQHLIHRIPAGMMQDDNSTELFGDRNSGKVFAISKGNTIPFEKLDPEKRSQIFEMLLNDSIAMQDLKHLSQDKAIEQFAFCVFGAADSNPDFDSEGNLKEADNFICSENCKCLRWHSKKITIDGVELTQRQLEIAQLLATDMCDKQIADKLGICHSTLDTHKKTLFEKCNVNSKTSLVIRLIEQKIIQ